MKSFNMVCHVLLSKEADEHAEHVYNLILEQIKAGIDLCTVTHPSNPISERLTRLNIPNVAAPVLMLGHHGVPDRNIRVFQAHDEKALVWCAIHQAINKKNKFMGSYPRVSNVPGRMLNWAYNKADILLACNSKQYELLKQIAPERRIEDCSLLTDDTLWQEKFNEIYTELGLYRDDPKDRLGF